MVDKWSLHETISLGKGKIVATWELDQEKPGLGDLPHAEPPQSQKIFLQSRAVLTCFPGVLRAAYIHTAVLNIPSDSAVFPHDVLEGVALFHCPVFVVF